jgi:hypothetical protein
MHVQRSHVGGADAGSEDDTEWADQERRLQQPDLDVPAVPLHRPDVPDSLHAPGDGGTVSQGVGHAALHAAGGDAQVQPNRKELQAPGKKQSETVAEAMRGATRGSADAGTQGSHVEEMCVDVDRIWFSFGSPVTVYSLPEVCAGCGIPFNSGLSCGYDAPTGAIPPSIQLFCLQLQPECYNLCACE